MHHKHKLIRLRLGLAVFAMLLGQTATVRADYTVTLDPRPTWGVWEGWGTSLAWWAKVFGTRDDLADLMFTTNYTVLNGTTLPGLGLNIARYNAGASSWNSITNGNSVESMWVPWTMIPDRQMEGFWLNWNSTNYQDPTSANWDWSVDANQRSMLLKAKARGANKFELFANSPMWWMCYNKNPCGNGGSDNLQWWNYNDHAVYLATVAQYAQTNWGITFDGVEPFNEPIDSWWVAEGAQEGCHYDRSTQASVISELRNELDERGLTNMVVAASDEFGIDRARDTWNSFSSSVRAKIGRVNVHGYQFGGGRRDLLYNDVSAGGARLWTSEYGDKNDTTGEFLAYCINLDFRWMRLTGWCFWQPFDTGNWGLIQCNTWDRWIGQPLRKYYVFAHYTRHIRAGMTILDGYQDDTVVAYDKTARKLVLVTMNYNVTNNITYNLTNFYNAAGPVRRWKTELGNTSVTYAQSNDIVISNRTFQAGFAGDTIQTFEIQNVDIYGPPPNISLVVSNGNMTLAWPESHLGWILQSNRTAVGAVGGWFDIPDTSVATNLNVIPSSTSTNVFYRLRSP
jgi:galactan endo-1,6-beta-galactosidase